MNYVPFCWALHKKSWAVIDVIDRPYSLACATVGALYERPRCIFGAKPFLWLIQIDRLDRHVEFVFAFHGFFELLIDYFHMVLLFK